MKKTILITGSTDGIGKGLALKLVKEGHKVYIHGRNSEKLRATISEIKVESGSNKVDGFLADFSDLDSVKHMASEILEKKIAFDVVINNAGVYNSSLTRNKNGLDLRMVVNYLAPYLLTNTLLPLLKQSTDSRIINLSSAAQSPVSLQALSGRDIQSEGEMYAQSKLALTMWSFYLAKQQNSVNVIAVNPGSLLNTKMVKEAFGKHWSSADKGVEVLYDLALSEEYNDITGKYFDNDKGMFGEAYPDAYDMDKIEVLIQTTESVLLEV